MVQPCGVGVAMRSLEDEVQLIREKPSLKSRSAIQYEFFDDGYRRETWPTKFLFPPAVGDAVQSGGGNILQIKAITHGPYGVILTLGKDYGGQDSAGGGGGDGSPY